MMMRLAFLLMLKAALGLRVKIERVRSKVVRVVPAAPTCTPFAVMTGLIPTVRACGNTEFN